MPQAEHNIKKDAPKEEIGAGANFASTNTQGTNTKEDTHDKPKKTLLTPTQRRVLGGISGAIVLSLLVLSAVPTGGGSLVLGAVIAAAVVGGIGGATSGKVSQKTLSISTVVGLVAGGILAGPPGAVIGATLGASLDGAAKQITGRSINDMVYDATNSLVASIKGMMNSLPGAQRNKSTPKQEPQHNSPQREAYPEQPAHDQSKGRTDKKIDTKELSNPDNSKQKSKSHVDRVTEKRSMDKDTKKERSA